MCLSFVCFGFVVGCLFVCLFVGFFHMNNKGWACSNTEEKDMQLKAANIER